MPPHLQSLYNESNKVEVSFFINEFNRGFLVKCKQQKRRTISGSPFCYLLEELTIFIKSLTNLIKDPQQPKAFIFLQLCPVLAETDDYNHIATPT